MRNTITQLAVVLPLALFAVCGNAESRSAASDNGLAAPKASEPTTGDAPLPSPSKTGAQEVMELDWDALIPADWRPDKLMEEYNADELSDDDPRALELLDRLKALWKDSPVVNELHGKRVKLPGFIVPLEMDEEAIREFLLVPYYGACIHVPPPPANQTVHVSTSKGGEYRGRLFDTVWVTGTLAVERLSSDLAEAGYRMQDARVEPYE